MFFECDGEQVTWQQVNYSPGIKLKMLQSAALSVLMLKDSGRASGSCTHEVHFDLRCVCLACSSCSPWTDGYLERRHPAAQAGESQQPLLLLVQITSFTQSTYVSLCTSISLSSSHISHAQIKLKEHPDSYILKSQMTFRYSEMKFTLRYVL